jgi:hypothetical protein
MYQCSLFLHDCPLKCVKQFTEHKRILFFSSHVSSTSLITHTLTHSLAHSLCCCTTHYSRQLRSGHRANNPMSTPDLTWYDMAQQWITIWVPHCPSRLISSHLILTLLVSSRLILSHLVSSHLILSHLVSSHLILSHLVSSLTLLVSPHLILSRLFSLMESLEEEIRYWRTKISWRLPLLETKQNWGASENHYSQCPSSGPGMEFEPRAILFGNSKMRVFIVALKCVVLASVN